VTRVPSERARRKGWPVHAVGARCGHDPAVLLRVYAHAGPGSQDRVDAVEALLDGARPPLRVLDGPAAVVPEAEDDSEVEDAPTEARRALP
jgi:hypothetical protein